MAGVGACIDISDGLLADLDHVLDRSGCAADLDLARVPRPPRFEAACARLGEDPIQLVTCGGEDYELLFTLRGRGRAAGRSAVGRSRPSGSSALARSREASGPRASAHSLEASGAARPTVAALSRRLGVPVTEIGKMIKTTKKHQKTAGWRHF
jgi:thiamine-monophosphate kinase